MGNCNSAVKEGQVDPPKPSVGNQTGTSASRFIKIRDRFETVEEVSKALRDEGLESSDLILAIDLTKSNQWSGKESFQSALAISCSRTHPAKLRLAWETLTSFSGQFFSTFLGLSSESHLCCFLVCRGPASVFGAQNSNHSVTNSISTSQALARAHSTSCWIWTALSGVYCVCQMKLALQR
jgi:hypothetical protein